MADHPKLLRYPEFGGCDLFFPGGCDLFFPGGCDLFFPDLFFPANDRTLVEWIRQCRRAGLYEQGRALCEKGGLNLESLTDEEQIATEDDYRICVSARARTSPSPIAGGSPRVESRAPGWPV